MQQVDPLQTDPAELEALAVECGATVLGEVPGLHYIFSVEELAHFVALLAVLPPPY